MATTTVLDVTGATFKIGSNEVHNNQIKSAEISETATVDTINTWKDFPHGVDVGRGIARTLTVTYYLNPANNPVTVNLVPATVEATGTGFYISGSGIITDAGASYDADAGAVEASFTVRFQGDAIWSTNSN